MGLQDNQRPRRSVARHIGLSLVVLGLLLVALGSGYYLYGIKARADLDRLVVDATQTSPATETLSTPEQTLPEAEEFTLGELVSLPTPSPEGTPPSATPEASTEPGATLFVAPDPTQHTLYPGESLASYLWDDPLGAQPPDPRREALLQGFQPVGEAAIALAGSLPRATHIIIPRIDVDAATEELAIVNLGDSQAYRTPNRVVGHIPNTPNPGERGNGWYFGHLESPIKGEGNVFQRLPDIPRYLKEGQEVHVILQSSDRQYLYRVKRTEVVHEDNLRLYKSQEPVITLVACVPRWYYDHRLLVTAELVGVKTLS